MQAAIAAIQNGDRARGRQLLLDVLEADDQNEAAWLWLSRAVDEAEHQRVALENVLALNPQNREARQRLAELSSPKSPPAPPSLAKPEAAPARQVRRVAAEAAPQEVEDDMDSPLLCIACARPTNEADRKCSHCGQNLIIKVRRSQQSEYLKLAQLILGIYMALGLIPLLAPLLSLGQAGGGRAVFDSLAGLRGVNLFLADFTQWTAGLARNLALAFGGRLAVFGVLLLGLSQRWAWAFYLTLAALVADLGLNLFLLANGYLGWAPGIANAVFALALLYLVGLSYQEFSIVAQRLYNQPDSDVRTAGAYYQRGREYGKLKLWALAVAQWRKAVGLAPKETLYYKELGLGYARIRRYERSLRVLEEAARQAPGDRQIPEIIALVRQQMERAGGGSSRARPAQKS
jgi:tetratricopeptide (TPR) repeat protein